MGRQLKLAAVAMAVLASGGCGAGDPARVRVEGVVTIDGAPLVEGSIVFLPHGQTKGPTSAGRIVNGDYVIERNEGPVIGEHQVMITNGRDPVPTATGVLSVDPPIHIPERYNFKTELTATTTAAGPNRFDFQLSTRDPVR